MNNIYLTPINYAQAQAHNLEVTCPSAPRPTSAAAARLESIQTATGPLFPCLDTAILPPHTDVIPAINRSDDGIFQKQSRIPNKRRSSVKNRSIPVSTLKPRLSCRTSISNKESAVVVSADDDIPSSKSKQSSRKSVVTNKSFQFQIQNKRQRRFSGLHLDDRVDMMPVLPRAA